MEPSERLRRMLLGRWPVSTGAKAPLFRGEQRQELLTLMESSSINLAFVAGAIWAHSNYSMEDLLEGID